MKNLYIPTGKITNTRKEMKEYLGSVAKYNKALKECKILFLKDDSEVE